MQDNVTQSDVTEADKDCCLAVHKALAGTGNLSASVDKARMAIAAHRLASTAQPEVKALVEALEAIKAQTSAEDDAGENYRWDDREGALDFAYATAAQALAAYHEAQP